MSQLDVLLSETERSFGLRQIQAGHARMLVMVRQLQHPIGEVWAAVSDPEVIPRFLSGVQGDLRRGGDFVVDGLAEGQILRCDPPRMLTVSWIPAHGISGELEFHLTDEEGTTRVELKYASVRKRFAVTDPAVPGWAAGPGWEFVLDNLSSCLDGEEPKIHPEDWQFLEGAERELYEARNAEWERVWNEFEREHAPLPAPE